MAGAGDLRESLRFDSPTSDADDYGNTTEGWTPEFTVPAQVRPLQGGETVLAERLAGTQPVYIRVRTETRTRNIRPDWRCVDARSGTVYSIASPPADMEGSGQFLDFLARSGVA